MNLQNNSETSSPKSIKVFIPEIDLTTDNAIMIGIAGYLKSFDYKVEINPEIVAEGNMSL
jgi:tRNA A37 threonylcarbamoyltransferase TsaD